MSSLASRLVRAANTVLARHTFRYIVLHCSGYPDVASLFSGSVYQLQLAEVKVVTAGDCGPLCEPGLSLTSLLHRFSALSHAQFCLSYLLTYRNFPGGTTGLAWTATQTRYIDQASKLLLRTSVELNTGDHALQSNTFRSIIIFWRLSL